MTYGIIILVTALWLVIASNLICIVAIRRAHQNTRDAMAVAAKWESVANQFERAAKAWEESSGRFEAIAKGKHQ